MKAQKNEATSLWTKAPVANLVRYESELEFVTLVWSLSRTKNIKIRAPHAALHKCFWTRVELLQCCFATAFRLTKPSDFFFRVGGCAVVLLEQGLETWVAEQRKTTAPD